MSIDEAEVRTQVVDGTPRWVAMRLYLLVAAHVLLQFAVTFEPLPPPINELLQIQTAVAGIVLMAIWCGAGSATLRARLASAAFGCALTSLFLVLGDVTNWPSLPGATLILFFSTLMIAGPVLWWNEYRARVVRFDEPQRLGRSSGQFTLQQLLISLTAIALLLGLIKLIEPRPGGADFVQVAATIQLSLVTLAIYAVGPLWAVLSPGAPWRRIAAVLALIVFISAAVEFAINRTLLHPTRNFALQVALASVAAALIILSLLVVRSCGFRLVRRASLGPGYFKI